MNGKKGFDMIFTMKKKDPGRSGPAKKIRRAVSAVLAIWTVLSLFCAAVLPVFAYEIDFRDTESILRAIGTGYSWDLEESIRDLFFDSDYSLFEEDSVTLRGAPEYGHLWPYTNADDFGTSVTDRGRVIDWDWYCAGCVSYACFFSCSVYGYPGNRSDQNVRLDPSDPYSEDDLKNYLTEYAQPGEHFRTIDRSHSVVFLCFDENDDGEEGFWIAEYLGGSRTTSNGEFVYYPEHDRFDLHFYTYGEFISLYKYSTWFLYDSYETSAYRGGGTVDPETLHSARIRDSLDIVLAVDMSGSMGGTKLKNTKKAVKAFFESVTEAGAEASLVSYDDRARILCGLTDDGEELCDKADRLRERSGTNLYEALVTAADILGEEDRAENRRAVVFMCDGTGISGGESVAVTLPNGETTAIDSGCEDVYLLCEEMKADGIAILPISFGIPEDSDDYALLCAVASADRSGKSFFAEITDVRDDDEVMNCYTDAAETVCFRTPAVYTPGGENPGENQNPPAANTHRITFSYEDGTSAFLDAAEGTAAQDHPDCRRLSGVYGADFARAAEEQRYFLGWVTDNGEFYDFSSPVLSDVMLFPLFGNGDAAQNGSGTEPETGTGEGPAENESGNGESVDASCNGGDGCPLEEFSDLDSSFWYHDGVHYCLENGIMNGVGGGLFSPDGFLTRGMLVTVLYRIEGEPALRNDCVFYDVAPGSWYEKAVVWASGMGLVNGYGDGRFGPDDLITREQMTAIFFRYAEAVGRDTANRADLSGFLDGYSVSDWAKESMSWAKAEGLINGVTDELLDPTGRATRAQTAAVLFRFFGK